MVPSIGIDVMHKGRKVHVQDVNNLSQTARIGVPDSNAMIWDTETVPWDELSEIRTAA